MKTITSGILVAMIVCGVVSAAPPAPVYTSTFNDSITGTRGFTATDGKRYYTIEAGADSYQNDVYERPTIQEYKVQVQNPGGIQHFASKQYFGNLDIVNAMFGFDSQYMYISIDMFSNAIHKDDGTNTPEGLKYQYGFRIGNNLNDPFSANGLLLVVDDPANKGSSTTFNGNKASAYRDTNGDVGGVGISVTKQDQGSQVGGNGYDLQVISDGKDKNNSSGPVMLFSRIKPTDNTIVEFAFDYVAYNNTFGGPNFLPSGLTYLEFEANKGLKANQNYLWNDEYTKSEAGSPYRATSGDLTKSEFGTQGLGNIYELDTLRAGAVSTVPEPTSVLLMATVLIGVCQLLRRRASHN